MITTMITILPCKKAHVCLGDDVCPVRIKVHQKENNLQVPQHSDITYQS